MVVCFNFFGGVLKDQHKGLSLFYLTQGVPTAEVTSQGAFKLKVLASGEGIAVRTSNRQTGKHGKKEMGKGAIGEDTAPTYSGELIKIFIKA